MLAGSGHGTMVGCRATTLVVAFRECQICLVEEETGGFWASASKYFFVRFKPNWNSVQGLTPVVLDLYALAYYNKHHI